MEWEALQVCNFEVMIYRFEDKIGWTKCLRTKRKIRNANSQGFIDKPNIIDDHGTIY
jgi:hypothetical protein